MRDSLACDGRQILREVVFMYESQFELKRRPFGATPDPRCFMALGSIQDALDELVVCVEQGQGIAVVSAPAGTGKTLLCEKLRIELGNRFETVYLRHSSFLTRRALLQTILCDLNHPYQRQEEQELRLELIPAIRSLNPRREALVLICDEAHLLTEDLLEELRILSDLAEHGRPLVRLVLVGQHALEETLASPNLGALSQRVRAHVSLENFDRMTSLDYIDYRLTWAGGRTEEVFTQESLDLLCSASAGVPRCINQLCDHSLLLAYVSEQKPVTPDTVRDALQDLRQLPLHWNESLVADSTIQSSREFAADSSRSQSIWNTAESDSQMQSIEIGADLPSSESHRELLEFPMPAIHDANSIIDVECIEPSLTSHKATVLDVATDEVALEDALKQEIIAEKSSQDSQINIANGEPQNIRRSISHASRGLVEEFVWDKYAAIDGGFSLPEPPSFEAEIGVVADAAPPDEKKGDTPAAEPVRIDNHLPDETPEIVGEATITQLIEMMECDATSVPIDTEGFDAVCQRLDSWLPEIHDNPVWDRQSSEVGAASEATAESPDADRLKSLEVDLGMAVYELVREVQAGLNPEDEFHSLGENLQEAMNAVVADEVRPTSQIEAWSSTETDELAESETGHATTIVAEGTSIRVRPFRNLFSMLRRKQQGLL